MKKDIEPQLQEVEVKKKSNEDKMKELLEKANVIERVVEKRNKVAS